MFKQSIRRLLEFYVMLYFKKNTSTKLIVIVGSIGKTTTKTAVGELLHNHYRVRYHSGNHNTDMSAPLAILGINYPKNIYNIFAWVGVFIHATKRLIRDDIEVIVQELGVEAPGDMDVFLRYLRPDLAIVTAITPEHMEHFKTIESVADTELSIAHVSDRVLVNQDTLEISAENLNKLKNRHHTYFYSTKKTANYSYSTENNLNYFHNTASGTKIPFTVNLHGNHMLYPIMAAMATASLLDLPATAIQDSLAGIKPVAGRMNMLEGIRGSTIIDDSYNSSPRALEAALRTLYETSLPHRIAIIGDMNELGTTSEQEHRNIGALCLPDKLSLLITVGDMTKKYLAPEARKNKCDVRSFASSIDAGHFVSTILTSDSVVLVKGSQGGIYLEESIKPLLKNSSDVSKLVRQSSSWKKQKEEFYRTLNKKLAQDGK